MKYNLYLFETPPPTIALSDEQIKQAIAVMPKADLMRLGNVSEIIASVRQEEKGKLYGEVNTLKDSLKILTDKVADADREKLAALEEQKRQQRENMSFEEKLATQTAEFNTRFDNMQRSADAQVTAVKTEFNNYQLSVCA